MLGRNPLTCFEVGSMRVQGSQSRLGQGRGLAAEAPRMGRGPTFLLLALPADQNIPETPAVAMSPEVVEWRVQFSACQGDGWCLGSKEKGREGDRMPLLTYVRQEATSGWLLFKPAALGPEPGPVGRPAGPSFGFLTSHWALGRYLTCPQPGQSEGRCGS